MFTIPIMTLNEMEMKISTFNSQPWMYLPGSSSSSLPDRNCVAFVDNIPADWGIPVAGVGR